MFLRRPVHLACTTIAAVLALAAVPASAASAATGDRPERPIERAVRAYESGDFTAARAAFERLARAGVSAAHYNLAVMALRGEVPDAAPDLALRHMRASADGGFVTAWIGLGEMFETGQGTAVDMAASHHWYCRAAAAGSAHGQVACATNHYLGRGTPRDRAEAARWYERAAEAGDVGAQYVVASMHETGDGVPKDLEKARLWYVQAARNGDPIAGLKVHELDARGSDRPPLPR